MLHRDSWRSTRTAVAPWLTPATGSFTTPRGRGHRRVSVRTEIWLGHDGIFTRSPGELRDLSEGGALVDVNQRFAVGSHFNLRFQLPESPAYISSTVAVRNHRPDAGMGVQFVDLSDDDRRRIRGFVDRFGGSSST